MKFAQPSMLRVLKLIGPLGTSKHQHQPLQRYRRGFINMFPGLLERPRLLLVPTALQEQKQSAAACKGEQQTAEA